MNTESVTVSSDQVVPSNLAKKPLKPMAGLADTPPASDASSIRSETPVRAQEQHKFRDLLPELKLEEKVALVSGTSFTTTAEIPRLGIPRLKVSDSVTGVRGSNSHLEDSGTACFPSTTCLASTWNKELLRDFGEEVAVQAKLKSVQLVLGPNVNLHRDPRGGRNFETFSEDPFLTGVLAASIINGMQSHGVGACVKHFVGNESETLRRKYNVRKSGNSRTMRELYICAFQHVLRLSKPVSIMTAYNKIDGSFCSQTPLLKNILRNSWGYDGCIMSDWYGTHSGADALEAGLDLEMPGPSVFRGEKLVQEIKDGALSEKSLDRAVHSVLTMIDRTAESHSTEPEQTITTTSNSMARRLAAEGIVLLKNEHNVLPLDIRKAPSITVVGAAATKPSVSGGGSACANSQYVQAPLDCLRAAHPCPDLIKHARGVNANYTVPLVTPQHLLSRSGRAEIVVEYYNNDSVELVSSEVSENPQVIMMGRLRPELKESGFIYIMKTSMAVKTSGLHTLAVQVTGDFSLSLDGIEVLSGPAPDMTVEDFLFVPKKLERATKVYMHAGQPYAVRLSVKSRKPSNNGEPTVHAAKLCFEEEQFDRLAIAEAVSSAAQTDLSIIFGGRTKEHESEGFDLDTLKLPDIQVRMIKAVASVSARTVLILHGGNPIDVSDFIDDVDVVLASHFPGQEGGQAITDIITGKTNPSGRLATSWPLRLDNCVPSFSDFPAIDRGEGPEIEYAERLEVGYRNHNAAAVTRWPFGFGLSYSKFICSDLTITPAPKHNQLPYNEQVIQVSVKVHNEGRFPGHHVVQLYSEPPPDSLVWRPKSELRAFTKVYLIPGETKTVYMNTYRRDVCGTWEEEQLCWRTQAGMYGFQVENCRSVLEMRDNETWTGL